MKKFLKQEPVEAVTPKGDRVTVIRQFCKGCRMCVNFCPTGALELDERFKVYLAHPEKCTGCRMCELRCPDMAIFVDKALKEQAEKKADEAREPAPEKKEK